MRVPAGVPPVAWNAAAHYAVGITMSSPSQKVNQIWTDQCAAAEGIRESFGLENALDYLIGEKLFTFVMASERDPSFAAELPAFLAEIRRIFSDEEIREYLERLERDRFLAPQGEDEEFDDLDEDADEEPLLENPVMGAEELLRFARIRQLLA